MEKPSHILGKDNPQGLVRFLSKNGQALLPMVELVEQSKMAVDELIDVLGRAQIEAVLRLSAEGIAGPPHPGKKGGRSAGREAKRARCACRNGSCEWSGRDCARRVGPRRRGARPGLSSDAKGSKPGWPHVGNSAAGRFGECPGSRWRLSGSPGHSIRPGPGARPDSHPKRL